MTEKLFYTDSHLQEFTAEVVSCRPCDNGYEAVLSRTAFFPEGGGQAADTGVIDGIRVYDVQEKGEQIFHYLEGELEEGKTVTGQIDWDKRFSRMQQHSGEHIVSGIVHARFGYDNVGFHLNDELCTLDLSGPLTKEELREVENAANEAVFANVKLRWIPLFCRALICSAALPALCSRKSAFCSSRICSPAPCRRRRLRRTRLFSPPSAACCAKAAIRICLTATAPATRLPRPTRRRRHPALQRPPSATA